MSDANHMAAFGDFGKWVPGFEFLKGLTQPGGSSAALPQMPSLGSWVAPTLNVEELDQRIKELKTVLFWLEQNGTALKATIQAMEVQKMTLATLQGMNVSMQEMAQAFSIPTPGAPASAPAAAGFAGLEVPPLKSSKAAARPKKPSSAESEPAAPSAAKAAGPVDPMQWWGSLTQQFQTIADAAMKDAKARAPEMPTMKGGADLAASAGKAGELLSQAIKTGTEAWTDAAKKVARAGAKPPAQATTRKPAGKSNAAPARKTAAKRAR